MDAYYSIWRLLKINKRNRSLLNFSYYLVKIAHSAEVSYEDWLKSYILLSKALFLDGKLDDALELLRGLLDIFANIPLDDIKYLSEINKNNKISLKNNFFNFDYALSFYSKYHVYSKCEAIFKSRFKLRENKISWDLNLRGASSKNTSQITSEKFGKSLNEEENLNDISDDCYTENYSRRFDGSPLLRSPLKSQVKKNLNTSNNSYIEISNNGIAHN